MNTLGVGIGRQTGALNAQDLSARVASRPNNEFINNLLDAFRYTRGNTSNGALSGQTASRVSDTSRPKSVAASPFLAARTSANLETATASPKSVSTPATPTTPTTPSTQDNSTSSIGQHPYVSNAADDAYWAKQPAAVQQLREIDDPMARQALATQLSEQGYAIDTPIMVWGWDAGATTALRQQFQYTWVPAANQPNVTAAPGLSGGGITPYDPNNPPAGSIMV